MEAEKGKGGFSNGSRQELLGSSQTGRSNKQYAMDNDDFITSESDRQMLLMR